jgi:uncharacterized protein YpbB
MDYLSKSSKNVCYLHNFYDDFLDIYEPKNWVVNVFPTTTSIQNTFHTIDCSTSITYRSKTVNIFYILRVLYQKMFQRKHNYKHHIPVTTHHCDKNPKNYNRFLNRSWEANSAYLRRFRLGAVKLFTLDAYHRWKYVAFWSMVKI